MVRKGLIKVEQLNSRTMRYILTPPQGMKEKTRLTHQYVCNSYHQIMSITRALEDLIESEQVNRDNSLVVLYEPADEETIADNNYRSFNLMKMI